MKIYDIITKKRDGYALKKSEIDFFVQNYVNGYIPDYQMSALLMAIYFQKMNKEETVNLTNAMVNSGEIINLSSIDGIKVDKHSTGGVGDTTTIVVAPLVAECGVPVAKMSGRGLGHTGGTIDKLESFSGFSTEMTRQKFINNVNKIKIAIASQTANLVPADKMLYALRDVTGTVENMSLIASSIMSKKIASGADAIVLDVKVGSGAFMKDLDSAIELAQEMVDIGTAFSKNTIAVVTDMSQPLGNAIGNSLEVIEAINTLKGNGPEDLTKLSLTIGSYMLMLGGKTNSFDEGKAILKSKIEDMSGLFKLKQMVKMQGVNDFKADWISNFVRANNIIEVKAQKSGYIKSIKADEIGLAMMTIGAGRETKDSKIDLTAGIILSKKIGDFTKINETIATIELNNIEKAEEAKKIILNAYTFSDNIVKPPKLIKAVITNLKNFIY